MNFQFTHKLPSGAEVEVEAEVCIRKEEVAVSIALPWGSGSWLDGVISDVLSQREAIEGHAWELANERAHELAIERFSG
jgi:DNA-binding FadR family transcriptional regulator